MIIFFPRDIGVWRTTFNFTKKERPFRPFNDLHELKQFCKDHDLKVDDPDYPFYIKDKYVMCWTVIGYLK